MRIEQLRHAVHRLVLDTRSLEYLVTHDKEFLRYYSKARESERIALAIHIVNGCINPVKLWIAERQQADVDCLGFGELRSLAQKHRVYKYGIMNKHELISAIKAKIEVERKQGEQNAAK